MSDSSKIEWCDATWNPVVGCSPVDPGCAHCYAVETAARVERQAEGRVKRKLTDGDARVLTAYRDLTVVQPNGVRGWSGAVRCLPERLEHPLRWKRPRVIFVNSMSDLFHEDVPFDFIDKVFAVMALAGRHRFIVLTKRSARMREYAQDRFRTGGSWFIISPAIEIAAAKNGDPNHMPPGFVEPKLPLPNVVLGVSVSDRATADKHIPNLVATPARWRAISYEPALGPLGIFQARWMEKTDWAIFGGESGHGARPCNVAWARSALDQCRAAGTAFFLKQLGCRPYVDVPVFTRDGEWLDQYLNLGVEYEVVGPCGAAEIQFHLRDRAGRDWDEWPADLRVREFPWDPCGDERRD